MDLPGVREDIGHVLAHYLYAGTYQTLKPKDVSQDTNDTTEFKRSMLAYRTALTYGLVGLETQAKNNMERFEKRVAFNGILDVVIDACSELPEHQAWFHGYLENHIKTAFKEDEALFTKDCFVDRFTNNE